MPTTWPQPPLPATILAAFAQGADAELLQLCSAFTVQHDILRAANAPASGISDDECDAASERWHELAAHITVTRARSPAGLRAKAQVARAVLRAKLHENSGAQTKELICWSLIRDVLGSHDG